MKNTGTAMVEIDASLFELRNERLVKRSAVGDELLKGRAAVAALARKRRQHARRGARSLVADLAALQQRNAGAFLGEVVRRGAADDATANDYDVWHALAPANH